MRLPSGFASAPESIVRGLSRALGGATWSRRSFLVRTSLVGSALVIDPKGFALEPHSAFEAVCGNDADCDDGFTVFCCTIEDGANVCPEGTFVGGWWKADRSAFCRGAARYYVDCNGQVGWPWRCHCPDTATCDHRHVACVQFRYGNCNLEIPAVAYGSPVVCRVVTCTPPWIWDPACTTTSFTDDLTVSQSAPCLPGPWPSPIIMKWSDLGGPGGPLGQEVSGLERLAGIGEWVTFRNGAIYDLDGLGVLVVDQPVWHAVQGRIGRDGIGYPLNDRTTLVEGGGWFQAFGRRVADGREERTFAVGSEELGTFVVAQPVLGKWHKLGAEGGVLGYPSRDTRTTPDKTSTFGIFTKLEHRRAKYRGAIFVNPVLGAHEVHGEIFEKWASMHAEAGPLGYPASDERLAGAGGATFNEFAVVRSGAVASRSAIFSTKQYGTWAVVGSVFAKWVALGAQRGALGYPTSDERTTPDGAGVFSSFRPLPGQTRVTGGGIVSTASRGTWALLGSLFTAWLADEAGPRVLGVPTADEVDQVVAGVKLRSQQFSSGAVFDSAVGTDCVLYGQILAEYTSDGGPTGSLGLPTSSVMTLSNGDQQATFQFGTLTYVPVQGVRRR